MPILSILTFFATLIFIIGVGLYIYFTFHNKRTQLVINKFINQAKDLKPTVFRNVKLDYAEIGGLRKQMYINNSCDLYLFDNALAIIRRQDFIFKVFFAPILLTPDITTTKNDFQYLKTYKPNLITFKQVIKGEVDIKLTDPIYEHYTTEITLQGLTNEQLNQLEKTKNWCQ